MAKKYSLSKGELKELTKIINLASMQQELLKAIQIRYKLFVTNSIFKRLSVDIKLFPKCVVDLDKGELIIDENKKEKKK